MKLDDLTLGYNSLKQWSSNTQIFTKGGRAGFECVINGKKYSYEFVCEKKEIL